MKDDWDAKARRADSSKDPKMLKCAEREDHRALRKYHDYRLCPSITVECGEREG